MLKETFYQKQKYLISALSATRKRPLTEQDHKVALEGIDYLFKMRYKKFFSEHFKFGYSVGVGRSFIVWAKELSYEQIDNLATMQSEGKSHLDLLSSLPEKKLTRDGMAEKASLIEIMAAFEGTTDRPKDPGDGAS